MTRENTDKNQTDFLKSSVGSTLDSEIDIQNKKSIESRISKS